ncbi:MAG: NADH-quinone oxidoreductase subunit H [Candidatus Omnitrophica bacterium]|nr:NADH-quinone oxidoreductase subunit H [Candidatus Omnitrophota bacterium]
MTFFLGGWHAPGIPWVGGWRQILIPFGVVALLLAFVVGTAKRLPLPARLLGGAAFAGAGLLWGLEPIPSWGWVLAKTYGLFFVLVWFRGTLPRLRIDQLMGLAWKFFVPLALVNILAAGLWVWYPFPLGTAYAALLLVLGSWILVRANAPAPLERRTYVLAE